MANDSSDVPAIHFAPAVGARIAYQVFGEGDETVVSVPPMAQNIEMAWEQPLIRRMLEGFGRFARFVIFDKRGTGSSDRTSRMPGLDERVDDLRAVMDHAGVEQAHLMGTSEGGPMAIMFAATYPDRVKSLNLHGTGARLIPDEVLQMFEDVPGRRYMMADVWGTPDSVIVGRFAPSMATDAEFVAWHERYERRSATADSMRELIDLMIEIDVTEVLPQINVPTLVQHRIDDRVVPVEFARELAAAIDGAEMIEYEGRDHFEYVGELQPWLADVERFITGSVAARPLPVPRSTPRITTLGRFCVERDGVEVPTAEWGSRLSRQLCKRLVVARGWPVTREQLIDQLWPDESDMRKLGARLSVQLSAVRRVLGGGVVADRDTVRLDLKVVDVDIERWMAEAAPQSIVDGYREFLPGDRYEDWSAALRDEARARFISTAGSLAQSALLDQRFDDAASIARDLVAVDRFDDLGHALLVAACARAGRKSEATAAHSAWAEVAAELDVALGPFDDHESHLPDVIRSAP